MVLPRNTRSFSARNFTQAFAGFDKTLRDIFYEQPKQKLLAMRDRARNLPRTNFNLGVDFASQGKWKDAAFRFRVALYFQPNFAQAQYNLGCCLIRLNQRGRAKLAFQRALQLQPNYPDALFMLSALDPASVPAHLRPQRMSSEIVLQFFAGMAPVYDATEANNQYQGGRIAYDALKAHLAATRDLHIVDIGCGTGLTSRPWRPVAREITGIDFSPGMANQARLAKVAENALFDRVLEEDVTDVSASAAPFGEADVVLVVNVAQFIGNLEPLLKSLSGRLKPGALVALTVEPFRVTGGYGVNIETGRFGHQPDYVKQVAQEAGFTVKQEMRADIYPGYNAWMLVLGK